LWSDGGSACHHVLVERQWWGILDRNDVSDSWVSRLDSLADAARGGDWVVVLRLAADVGVNVWRPGGTSRFTPLHQAAWHGAPAPVVEALLELGAWRTLRTADDATARDIAERRGHDALVPLLTPSPVTRARPEILPMLDAHLQEVVDARLHGRLEVRLRPISTCVLTEWADEPLWFPVPGMYGGFSVRLMRNYLYVESWSRVVGGSGQAHVITRAGSTLVDQGFV